VAHVGNAEGLVADLAEADAQDHATLVGAIVEHWLGAARPLYRDAGDRPIGHVEEEQPASCHLATEEQDCLDGAVLVALQCSPTTVDRAPTMSAALFIGARSWCWPTVREPIDIIQPA
jgi:hypothetical protein